jgi:superfamily II DNA/RNA helicase
VMIFCRTKRSAQRVADDLVDRGFSAAPIHGDLNQAAREKALKRFREGTADVLVATDVAARGIDVTGVTHVINYECPEDEKTYIHRIGRTGRAGASGIAITFVDWADQTRWKVISNALGLPFEQPEETYSTSPHLYHDLGIDPNAKGRIKPSPNEGADQPRADRGDRGDRGDRPKRTERPRSRSRQRLRNGVAVEGEATTTAAKAPAAEKSERPPRRNSQDAPAAAVNHAEGDAPKRSRRRRRRSSEGGGSSTDAVQQA